MFSSFCAAACRVSCSGRFIYSVIFLINTSFDGAKGGMGACGADKNFMIDLRTHKQPGSGRRCIPPGVHGWEIYVKFSRKDFATTRNSDSGKNKHKTFITSTGITLYSKTGCPYTRSCEILVEIKSFEWFLNFLDR